MILKEMKMFATITNFDNVTRSAENALEDAFINNLNDLENSNFCENSDNKLPEVGEFEKSNETVNKFDESLIIANGGDSTDLLFFCYVMQYVFLNLIKLTLVMIKKLSKLLAQIYIMK